MLHYVNMCEVETKLQLVDVSAELWLLTVSMYSPLTAFGGIVDVCCFAGPRFLCGFDVRRIGSAVHANLETLVEFCQTSHLRPTLNPYSNSNGIGHRVKVRVR